MSLQLWDTATGAAFTGTPTDPTKLYVSSGSTAVFIAHQADLAAVAGGAVTEFSWKARVTDFRKNSDGTYVFGSWSATCNGTAYTFTVTAANAVGAGSASAPTSPVTAR